MKMDQFLIWRIGARVSMFLAMIAGFSRGAGAEYAVWREKHVIETPGWLPVSVAFSPEKAMLVIGGTGGKVLAIDPANKAERWRADVGGTFAAVAFAADGKSILATYSDGARFLDQETGRWGASLEEKESRPRAVGVFPDREIASGAEKLTYHKVIFGNARSYYVKSWIESAEPGGIQLVNVAEGKEPSDPLAVPLAVDPAGRSVVLTGPIHRDTGKNVLWAWVAGDYEEGSPGNRLLPGHEAAVVSATWAPNGKILATGDAAGRLILWDAATMKEIHRHELGDRVAALALSPDGSDLAAAAIGKQAKFHVWKTAAPANHAAPIYVDASSDYSGPVHACLAFSHDGKQLAGSAINLAWLARSGELVGKTHVWESEPAR
jgi:WD40 repeat protein